MINCYICDLNYIIHSLKNQLISYLIKFTLKNTKDYYYLDLGLLLKFKILYINIIITNKYAPLKLSYFKDLAQKIFFRMKIGHI